MCHALRAAFRWERGRFLMLFPNSQPNKTQKNHFIAHHLPFAGGRGECFHPFLPVIQSTHQVFLQSAATLPAFPSNPHPLGHHPLASDCPLVVGQLVVDYPLLAFHLWDASSNKSSNHHWARDNPAPCFLQAIPFRNLRTSLVSSTQTLLLPLFPTFLFVRFRL